MNYTKLFPLLIFSISILGFRDHLLIDALASLRNKLIKQAEDVCHGKNLRGDLKLKAKFS
jgi:hypothetical protein